MLTFLSFQIKSERDALAAEKEAMQSTFQQISQFEEVSALINVSNFLSAFSSWKKMCEQLVECL